jgi:hypothetical protein
MFVQIFFDENIYLSASYIFLKLNGSNKTKMHGEWRQSFGNINEDIDLCEVKVNGHGLNSCMVGFKSEPPWWGIIMAAWETKPSWWTKVQLPSLQLADQAEGVSGFKFGGKLGLSQDKNISLFLGQHSVILGRHLVSPRITLWGISWWCFTFHFKKL